ncbi:MAG: YbbR-like domain-containing protein [Chloroflexota bacterium]
MQSRDNTLRQVIIRNLVWFAVSAFLAFLVWVIATTQADPISEERFRARIPIALEYDEQQVEVVDQSNASVWVTVRAQRSVQDALLAEDITVRADLTGLGPGTYTVELETELTRRGIVDTQPRQITVTLEAIRRQQVPVVVEIPEVLDLPPNFTREEPVLSETQVTVSGIASLVEQVVAAQVTLDLSEQRDALQSEVRLTPIDADGESVNGVTVEPALVEVTIDIRRREDLREVSVSPNIDASTLPEGYTLSFSYSPQTVFLVGSRDELSDTPNPLVTERIDLTDRIEDFQVTVPIVFPDGEEIPILGEKNITVFFEIEPQITTRQFENIPVEIVGLTNPDYVADAALDSVVVLVTGPESAVRDLTSDEINVVIDLNGREPGTYEITPQVNLVRAGIDTSGVSINPATITVSITDVTAPEATPESETSLSPLSANSLMILLS